MQFLFQFNTWPLVTTWWPSQSAVPRDDFSVNILWCFPFPGHTKVERLESVPLQKNIPPQAQPGNFNVWTGAVFHQVKFELVASTRLKHISQFESFPQGPGWTSKNIWNHHMRVLEYLMRQYLLLDLMNQEIPEENWALNGKTHRFVGIL